jgi:hypothetical protein
MKSFSDWPVAENALSKAAAFVSGPAEYVMPDGTGNSATSIVDATPPP